MSSEPRTQAYVARRLETLGSTSCAMRRPAPWLRQGWTFGPAQVRLGHSDPRLTKGVYAQASPESSGGAAREHFLGQDDLESDGECAMDVPWAHLHEAPGPRPAAP